METLYPIFYGTRMVPFDVLVSTFEPHLHPVQAERGFNWILDQGGKAGIGGGYRPPGTQPNASGYAPPGKSFHEGQEFPSGRFYTAWDLVMARPGHRHRAPYTNEVPLQGSFDAAKYGVHINVGVPGKKGFESWHMQPIELDGYDRWVYHGRPDLDPSYPYEKSVLVKPDPVIIVPPTPPTPPTESDTIVVNVKSQVYTRGDVGSAVKFFQSLLNDSSGASLELDGRFGANTQKAVSNWQKFFKLESANADLGVLNAETQKSIIEISMLVA